MKPEDLTDWSDWIGRKQRSTAEIRLDVTDAMAATLDLSEAPSAGDALPPGWHWLLFNPKAPARELDTDGHPKRGGLLPPIPLPRRMWAAGRLAFHRILPIGAMAERESEIVNIERKQGRQGQLAFVKIRHLIRTAGDVAIEEEQDIVYRQPPPPGGPSAEPPADAFVPGWSEDRSTDSVLLFRYSALTFNGHRIHYDAPYATEIERYEGLVVHGPLIATLLMDAVARHAAPRRLRGFEYRAVRPLIVGRPFRIAGRAEGHARLSVRAAVQGGAPSMVGSADLA